MLHYKVEERKGRVIGECGTELQCIIFCIRKVWIKRNVNDQFEMIV